jgi:prepilin-type N-terminal cleavage/methylation domain-containing protein
MCINRKGFTLVEIMLVVSTVSLLAAIAVPNLIKARETTQFNKCKSNARLIREAIDQWATDKNKASNDSPASSGSDCLPYIKGGKMPVCAADEVYTLSGTITNLTINCSVHGDIVP